MLLQLFEVKCKTVAGGGCIRFSSAARGTVFSSSSSIAHKQIVLRIWVSNISVLYTYTLHSRMCRPLEFGKGEVHSLVRRGVHIGEKYEQGENLREKGKIKEKVKVKVNIYAKSGIKVKRGVCVE